MDTGPSQGSGQLSDIIQLSSETQCRSRSLRAETNIQQDVKCELKVKPCECVEGIPEHDGENYSRSCTLSAPLMGRVGVDGRAETKDVVNRFSEP